MRRVTDPVPPRPDDIARLHAALAGLPESASADGSAPAFVAAARSALLLARLDDAVTLGRAALALDPEDARAWAVVGDALWAKGRAADARVALEEAVARDDKDLVAAVACARAQAATGAPSSARALLTFVLTRTRTPELRATALALLDTLGGEHPTTSSTGGAP
jgi:thioredoxin-like negative regulator of GroEL